MAVFDTQYCSEGNSSMCNGLLHHYWREQQTRLSVEHTVARYSRGYGLKGSKYNKTSRCLKEWYITLLAAITGT